MASSVVIAISSEARERIAATRKRVASLFFLTLMVLALMSQAPHDQRQVRVVALDSNSNQSSQSNVVTLLMPTAIYLPTAFSPNGDGLNDTFSAEAEGVDFFEMIIFDRWGHQVYHTYSLDNGWDGTIDDQPAPIGAYAYEMVAEGSSIGRLVKTGVVTLVYH